MRLFYLILSLFTLPLLGEQTLSIIKPNAVKEDHIGEIIAKFEANQLHVAALKMVKLSNDQARAFYQEHETRPFYPALIDFMTSGPVVVMVLEGDDAVQKNRELMGATDPQKAQEGTLRKSFAKSVTENAVHGSDSKESAKREIDFFFSKGEIVRGEGR